MFKSVSANVTKGSLRAWVVTASVLCALVSAAPGLGAAAALANPCDAVPGTAIRALLGMKTAPTSTLATVTTMQTCSYTGVKLTVSVGLTVIQNPATPAKVKKVTGLPHGTYTTYAGSTQSQVLFYTGSAATGTYGVIRNYGKIREIKLEKIARTLYHAMASGQPSGQPAAVKIVTSS